MQVGVNAILGAAENFVGQVKSKGLANVDYGETISAGVIGGVAGAIGGSGVGSKNYTKLGFRSVKRVLGTLKQKGIRAAKAVIPKAKSYYLKHTTKLYPEIIGKRAILKGFGTSAAVSYANYRSSRR